MMWTFIGLLLLVSGGLGAPVSSCPKSCTCTVSEFYLKVHCKSFNGLQKSQLSPEQITAIIALDVNGLTTKTNPDLSHLTNLRNLTLASNKIQEIVVAHLPISLEYLDLSKNFIIHPPQALELLPALKEVNLIGNPVSCNCASVDVRDILLEKGVNIVKRVKCESPENLRGKDWSVVSCEHKDKHLFGGMQGDAPYEGSGSDDFVTDNETSDANDKWEQSIEDEYMRVGTSSPTSENLTTTTEATEFEGSGEEIELKTEAIPLGEKSETTESDEDDEDYDDLTTELPEAIEPAIEKIDLSHLEKTPVKACNFNCSTPSPISDSNDTDTLPPPGLIDGLKMVWGDVVGEPESTTAPSTTTITISSTESTVAVNTADSGKENEGDRMDKSMDLDDTEFIGEGNSTTSTKENFEEPTTAKTNSTIIFLSVLLLVIICLVVYAILKKRLDRQNSQALTNGVDGKEKIPEEMELIGKTNPEADKPNGTHETLPLIKGHNENQQKTAEEAAPQEPLDEEYKNALNEVEDDEDVEVQPNEVEQKNLLTPEAKRVTIKASEIPNSTPKTPLLVNRHVNSDGSVVTTPHVDQIV